MAYLEIEDGTKLHCWFNPKEYTITKASTFNAKAAAGKDMPPVQYGGGQPASADGRPLLRRLHGQHRRRRHRGDPPDC